MEPIIVKYVYLLNKCKITIRTKKINNKMKLINCNFPKTVEWTENVSDKQIEQICSLRIVNVSFQLELE